VYACVCVCLTHKGSPLRKKENTNFVNKIPFLTLSFSLSFTLSFNPVNTLIFKKVYQSKHVSHGGTTYHHPHIYVSIKKVEVDYERKGDVFGRVKCKRV
jgi:hypothetical protein